MPFLPDWSEWIRSHIVDIPRLTTDFCGDLSQLTMLDVGCGDMIADVGLLGLGVDHITGLDLLPRDRNVEEYAVGEVVRAGFRVPDDWAARLKYVTYQGSAFPFPDNSFDCVFSWSAFEHIADVPYALSEIRRVVKPTGRVFIQVFPWFTSYPGSHLADFISQPFFHLAESEEQIRSRLEAFAEENPDKADLVLNHMWREYRALNRYSARRFIGDVLASGLVIERMQSTIGEQHLSAAPPDISIADLTISGSMLLMRPGKPVTQDELVAAQLREELRRTRAELALERRTRTGMQSSKSWMVTRPLRALAELVRLLRR